MPLVSPAPPGHSGGISKGPEHHTQSGRPPARAHVPGPLGLHPMLDAGEASRSPLPGSRLPLSSAISLERSFGSTHRTEMQEGTRKKSHWPNKIRFICVRIPWRRDACLCGQNPLLSAYYSSGKSDSLQLPNCGWKSSVLGAEKDALLQNCPLASDSLRGP